MVSALSHNHVFLGSRWHQGLSPFSANGPSLSPDRGARAAGCHCGRISCQIVSGRVQSIRPAADLLVHVLRRSHSSLMRDRNVDPKLVADQQGVPGEFVLMPQLVFGTAHDNVAANEMI
jgi:hypothetical protein